MKMMYLSAPVRHAFMLGTVWNQARMGKNPDFRILEVGSWCGASALTWAEGLALYNDVRGSITCVDAWKPYDSATHEMRKHISDAYALFQQNMRTIPPSIKVHTIRDQSDCTLPRMKQQHFDIIYIDGDHSYDSVFSDISMAMPLVKEGGIICGDDLNLQLHEVNTQQAKFNRNEDTIEDVYYGHKYHPGVTLAVAELLGDVSSWGGYWAMQRHGDDFVPITLNGMPIAYPSHFPPEVLADAQAHMRDVMFAGF